ncbi:hypothetical protein [Priestia aryabhattai]|uniref:hypothetical protein n=1 Tax=Priestia aryabhattai TaxID=412384 RepID=UPI002380BFC5|nr:hypothetical protein [Priestia aryabhattai]WDW07788.1 hypothetical protein PWC21_20045 [Priestia aryabhattai]
MKVKRKLFGLWTGELTAALLFAALWIECLNEFSHLAFYLTTFSSVYAFIILEFILFQGSLYWFMKWRRVSQKEDSHLPSSYIQLFLLFKKMNKILLTLGLGVLIYHYMQLGVKGLAFFLGLYAFAWIEYINYYVIRLSYQSPSEIKEFFEQKGFKRSILAREIDKNQCV